VANTGLIPRNLIASFRSNIPGSSRIPPFQTLGDPAERTARTKGVEDMLVREREALDELRADRDAWKQQATALLFGPLQTSTCSPEKELRWWPQFG